MSIEEMPIVPNAKAIARSAPRWEIKTKARIHSSLRSLSKTSSLLKKRCQRGRYETFS